MIHETCARSPLQILRISFQNRYLNPKILAYESVFITSIAMTMLNLHIECGHTDGKVIFSSRRPLKGCFDPNLCTTLSSRVWCWEFYLHSFRKNNKYAVSSNTQPLSAAKRSEARAVEELL